MQPLRKLRQKPPEANDLVKRTDYKDIPPRVDHRLTPPGHSLAQALAPLCIWGAENMAEVTAHPCPSTGSRQKRTSRGVRKAGAKPWARATAGPVAWRMEGSGKA